MTAGCSSHQWRLARPGYTNNQGGWRGEERRGEERRNEMRRGEERRNLSSLHIRCYMHCRGSQDWPEYDFTNIYLK